MGDLTYLNGLPAAEFAPAEAACPDCSERRRVHLTLDFDESVVCSTCGERYFLPGSLKRLIGDLMDARLREAGL